MITIEPPSSWPPSGTPGEGASGGAQTVEALRRRLRAYVRRAQELAGIAGEVSVLLTDDTTMRRLNKQFRGKNKSTDVLSFPAMGMEGLPPDGQGESAGAGGDIAISLPIAAAQASEFGHSVEVELRVLLLHGMLHLAGMDHEADGGEMAARELELRQRLRLPGGLIDRTGHLRPMRTGTAAGGRTR